MFGFGKKKKKEANRNEAIFMLMKAYEEAGIESDLATKMAITNITISDALTGENEVISPVVLMLQGMAFHRGHFLSDLKEGKAESDEMAQMMVEFYEEQIVHYLGFAEKTSLTDREFRMVHDIKEAISKSSGGAPDGLGKFSEGEYSTYENWYMAYKKAAGEANPQLEVDEEGKSLIDFMEDEPTRRAFRDGIDPKQLGKMFADQFDITEFGQR